MYYGVMRDWVTTGAGVSCDWPVVYSSHWCVTCTMELWETGSQQELVYLVTDLWSTAVTGVSHVLWSYERLGHNRGWCILWLTCDLQQSLVCHMYYGVMRDWVTTGAGVSCDWPMVYSSHWCVTCNMELWETGSQQELVYLVTDLWSTVVTGVSHVLWSYERLGHNRGWCILGLTYGLQ